MGPLRNARHEKLARLLAEGIDQTEAYQKVYGGKYASCRANAARLIANDKGSDILDRKMQLQAESGTAHTLTMRERREFLARTVRAKLHSLDLEKDGDLITEHITEESERGTRVKIKISDKRACIMDDAKLAGELTENVDMTSGGEPMAMQIIFAEPAISARRKK